jgi:DNA (cytosine-5)-methyltransferase 1
MRYLSVCSGIEAASVAWHGLGWVPVAFSEIDPFASAVLAERFPHVPNLGNMEAYRDWPIEQGAADVLVGGTPCQSFSVAGLRKGLDDPRGNLALVYLGILERLRPRWCVWENVPGVLSSNGGRDFGAFLGGLAQLGYGFAYRVLDAQFIRVESHPRAVPQRRRRVFVVGCAGGDWRSAAEVLLEPEGVRRDSAPRREAGKGSPRSPWAGAEGRSGETVDAPSFSWPVKGADPISAHEQHTYTHEGTTFRLHNVVPDVVAFQSNLGSQGGEKAVIARLLASGRYTEDNVASTVAAQDYKSATDLVATSWTPIAPLPFDTNQVTSVANRSNPQHGDPSHPLTRFGSAPTIAFAAPTMAVRRLTPRECERLQGFPDDWTAITYKGKPASDGPRYKALGNSMACNVMRWIGQRIANHESGNV